MSWRVKINKISNFYCFIVEKETATHSSILAWRIPMDRGVWRVAVHGVSKSRTWLSDWTGFFFFWQCLAIKDKMITSTVWCHCWYVLSHQQFYPQLFLHHWYKDQDSEKAKYCLNIITKSLDFVNPCKGSQWPSAISRPHLGNYYSKHPGLYHHLVNQLLLVIVVVAVFLSGGFAFY